MIEFVKKPSDYAKKIITVVVCSVLTAVFIVILQFAAPKITSLPETYGEISYSVPAQNTENSFGYQNYTAVIGEDVTAVCIKDFDKLNKITKVNYVANEFVPSNSLSPDIQVVDLTKPFDFAEKGTLIFIVMNLDAESNDFVEQSQKLEEYKIGEYWHFSFSLPKIFNASNVYVKNDLVARNGEIENYDFINFTTSYDKKTEKYRQKVEKTTLDLRFYTRRQALNQYQMVTVHYQSSGTAYSGIADCPLIGMENAVKTINDTSQDMLIAFAVLAAIVCAVFVVLSLLKRTKEFVNSIVWILGIVFMLFPRFMLGKASLVPLLWAAFYSSAAFLTLGGALFATGRNFGKFPAKYIFPALTSAGFVLAFISPFVSFGAATVLRTVYTVVKALCAIALLAFTGLATFIKDQRHVILETVTVSIIAVAVFASIFMTTVFPVYFNSLFWLCVVATITTFVGVFKVFTNTEKANAYLTSNLNLEVAKQLKEIKSVVEERDNLLQFVSHDMKKPLQSSSAILEELIKREKDQEQIKGLKIVRQHTSRVIENLSEIGSYARFNYIAEQSQVSDLYDLCAFIYEFHEPDCNANGIVLKNLVDKHYKAFVKRQGLENVVSNLVLNAIEHANCNKITLSAKTLKNKIVLCVTDDGKGIEKGEDVFRAYVSEKTETGGVGLFICKNIINSMNGELTYESEKGNTVFYITLLKA